MRLLDSYLRSEITALCRNNVRLRVIGNRKRLSPDIVSLIEKAEARTRSNDGLKLNIALSYGGRGELVEAAQRLARLAVAGQVDPEKITEESFKRVMQTADIPDPDLLIRTSGEHRLSNFLLWQLAYAELVFVDRLWPDFDRIDLEGAIKEFQRRDRRFGTCEVALA